MSFSNHAASSQQPKSSSTQSDNESVPPADVNRYGVVINVPTVYVNVDDARPSQCIQNLRVIPVDHLRVLMEMSTEIHNGDTHTMVELTTKFVDIIMQDETIIKQSNASGVLNFVKAFIYMAQRHEIDDDYEDSTNIGLSFDTIRKYVNDPRTTLLVEATSATYGNSIQFYSQLASQEEIVRCRMENNDTDMNRYHYCLSIYEKILMFRENYVYNKTIKLSNLVLFYACLVIKSRPIENMSSNDLVCQLFSFLMDAIFRTRIIQSWQRSEVGRQLLKDIERNYDNNNTGVAILRYKTPKERADFAINCMRRVPKYRDLFANIKYDNYERVLKNHVHEIKGEKYYLFDERLLIELMKHNNIESLSEFINTFNVNSEGDDIVPTCDMDDDDETGNINVFS